MTVTPDRGPAEKLSGDCIVSRECSCLREPFKTHGLRHLSLTIEDDATALLLAFGKIEIWRVEEPYGHNLPHYFHCCVTKRRGVPWVLSQGHGETVRGSIIMALTHLEIQRREALAI